MKKSVVASAPVLFILALLVMPVVANRTLYDETFTVKRWNYYIVNFEAKKGNRLEITIEVTGGDIFFALMGSDIYNMTLAGYIFKHSDCEIFRTDLVNEVIVWEVTKDDDYYCYFHNDNYYDVTVWLSIIDRSVGFCLGTMLIAAIPIMATVFVLGNLLNKLKNIWAGKGLG